MGQPEQITYEDAEKLFSYDVELGVLMAKAAQGRTWKGRVLGNPRADGSLGVSINGRTLLIHRVVWLLCNGDWPTGMIRHINGDKTDNRIDNLEEVGPYKNVAAVKEIAGISFVKKTERWKAVIHHQGNQYYLGEYEDKTEAVLTRYCAEQCLGLSINHEKSSSAWIKENL